MEAQTLHKTYQHKLNRTPESERALDRALLLCRHVYNAAIGERREAWWMRGVSVTYYQQKAELPGIKEALLKYGEVHTQVLHDVLLRVDRALHTFFRRVKNGETPGYPASIDAIALIRSPVPRWGRMARRDSITVSWSSRRLAAFLYAGRVQSKADPRRSRSPRQWTAGACVSLALTRPCNHRLQQDRKRA
jgi:hypothetical protein